MFYSYAVKKINDQNYISKGSVDVQNGMFGDQCHGFVLTYALSLSLCSYRKYRLNIVFVLWKVSFSVPKLDVKFRHLHERLSVDNNITGIQFTCAKSLPHDDLEEATPHLDVQIDLSEVHVILSLSLSLYLVPLYLSVALVNKILLCSFQLIREGSSSLLEVLKVVVIASLDVPIDVSILHFS